jgi:phage I-like protein
MNTFGILLDSPSKPSRPIQIAALGDYEDSRYGNFSITAADVDDWRKNMSVLPGGEVLIDRDHMSERKPRNSEAMGWLSNVRVDGEKVLADARWTPAGKKAIKTGAYKFVSVAYGDFENEHGQTISNTLCSVGLTNRPALTGLPAISLAAPQRVAAATAALKPKTVKTGKKKAAKQRKLEQRRAEVRTLEAKVASSARKLEAAEASRDQAVKRLDGQAFEAAFSEALRSRTVTPGERDSIEFLYSVAPQATLKMLDVRQAIMPDRPTSPPTIDLTQDQGPDLEAAAAAGFAPESVELDAQVRDRLRKLGRPITEYPAVLAEMIGGN